MDVEELRTVVSHWRASGFARSRDVETIADALDHALAQLDAYAALEDAVGIMLARMERNEWSFLPIGQLRLALEAVRAAKGQST